MSARNTASRVVGHVGLTETGGRGHPAECSPPNAELLSLDRRVSRQEKTETFPPSTSLRPRCPGEFHWPLGSLLKDDIRM